MMRSPRLLVCMSLCLFPLLACSSSDDDRVVYRPRETAARPLLDASEEVVARLAVEIERVTRENFQGRRIAFIIGDITNRGTGLSSTNVELLQNRIKNQLMKDFDRRFEKNVRVYRDKASWERARRAEFGEDDEDVLGTGSPQPVMRFRPDYSVALNAQFYRGGDPGEQIYYIAFNLMRIDTGEEIWTHDYEWSR